MSAAVEWVIAHEGVLFVGALTAVGLVVVLWGPRR